MPSTLPNPVAAPGASLVAGLGELAGRYDLILCDVWGVLHDGVAGFAAAGAALRRFREGGGKVILVSNAPRPGWRVARHLDQLGVPADAFDAIRTSGDLTRSLVEARGAERFHHIGPGRDLDLFGELPATPAALAESDYVVCTGLFDDEIETVEDYRESLDLMKRRDLLMICANPDLVVERGHKLILCAGALAAAYEERGGRTVTPGKPHPPIYEAALALGAELLGRSVDKARVLAIGDAIRTDIAGGHGAGIDTLLIARGIHAEDLGVAAHPLDPERAATWSAAQAFVPTFMLRELAWS